MTRARRKSGRLGGTVVAVLAIAAAVLAPPFAYATMLTRPASSGRAPIRLVSASPGVAGTTVPDGAVGGVRDPVEEGATLELAIDAADTGSGLVSAQASIDGNTTAISLCPAFMAGNCPEAVVGASLSVDVGAAGTHVLTVSVTNALGQTGILLERTIDVLPPAQPSTDAVTIGISAGHEVTAEKPPPEGSQPESPRTEVVPACASPALAMRLLARPRRYTRHHVPVVRADRRHRFTGLLTCLRDGRRVPAPEGTRVRVRYVHGCMRGLLRCTLTTPEPSISVKKGRLRDRLWIGRRGVLVFAYRPVHAESVQVKLAIAVEHTRRTDRGHLR